MLTQSLNTRLPRYLSPPKQRKRSIPFLTTREYTHTFFSWPPSCSVISDHTGFFVLTTHPIHNKTSKTKKNISTRFVVNDKKNDTILHLSTNKRVKRPLDASNHQDKSYHNERKYRDRLVSIWMPHCSLYFRPESHTKQPWERFHETLADHH